MSVPLGPRSLSLLLEVPLVGQTHSLCLDCEFHAVSGFGTHIDRLLGDGKHIGKSDCRDVGIDRITAAFHSAAELDSVPCLVGSGGGGSGGVTLLERPVRGALLLEIPLVAQCSAFRFDGELDGLACFGGDAGGLCHDGRLVGECNFDRLGIYADGGILYLAVELDAVP